MSKLSCKEYGGKKDLRHKNLLVFLLAGVIASSGVFTNGAAAYTIESDDTLYSISQQFETSVAALKEINNYPNDVIYVGDTMDVTIEDPLYTIEQGDTLYRIALEHDITVDQLQEWNGLNSNMIYAGDTLAVSGPLEEEVAASEVKSASGEESWTPPEIETPTYSGEAPSEGKTMTVEATAYTAYCEGCSGTTANGTNLRANPHLKVIAVDPRIIPLGTKVWVEGYGEAIAADTGGAIKGNKIDVFIPNLNNAYEWGRRTVTIKVLD
ncbi:MULTISPECIES: LysM peptidoglycan-binding domain-containing protein [Solibacillus]|uniref:LysM peptidoglycan-binding domain-containing protein n=1 Tax=Solibacillus merdavium TaxID=2762218 RepID=A0ABR8XQA7_9BACL|nr:LysM peptidoglycan-binding and 3D domain-containing protein [Solibacillus merdavium]MBD8034106.1 LysM peptidoglycan-binding domain-containing protein [Solibacillus merdavium]